MWLPQLPPTAPPLCGPPHHHRSQYTQVSVRYPIAREKRENILKFSQCRDNFFSSSVRNFVVVTQVEYPGLSHQAPDLDPNSWSLYLPNLCRGSGVKNKILSVDDTRCVIKPWQSAILSWNLKRKCY